MAATPQQDLTGEPWHWLGPDGGPLPPRDLYTLELTADGRALVRADCNRGGGRYTRDGERLALTPMATTKMGCPAGSLDTVFLRQLGEVERYRFEGDALLLERRGGGAMRFAR
jgi:heat shock protein HslJ